jgi:hypothetical protein
LPGRSEAPGLTNPGRSQRRSRLGQRRLAWGVTVMVVPHLGRAAEPAGAVSAAWQLGQVTFLVRFASRCICRGTRVCFSVASAVRSFFELAVTGARPPVPGNNVFRRSPRGETLTPVRSMSSPPYAVILTGRQGPGRHT